MRVCRHQPPERSAPPGKAGRLLSKSDYYPFGNERPRPNPSDPIDGTNNRLFLGQDRDREMGLDYMNARYCAPHQGRFMSADPLGGASNRYVASFNNPIGYSDPSGLLPISAYNLWGRNSEVWY